ncbi:MAG: M20/M25/M40 family metallo-hydrolase [Acidimicrobiaceae bacterium]|nr:M20/M25/M40 family metallo-hydrolase [Acidimicrobiaceae bacterium]MCY4293336.1 M20/M25/M40 family metallo-hydrolase [Acidimicrobiaceae bacterium]
MTGTPERIASAVDAEAVTELVREAVRVPSITPDEQEFARWAQQQMVESGAFDSVELHECEPGRPNVWGTVGNGSGKSLLLAGHMDTVAVDDWVQHWQGTDREDPFGAPVIDGEIWGRGAADQKAGICASIEALRAFRRVGLRPAGRVSTLFVIDEESGQPGSGVSAGMRAAVEGRSGPRPEADFAIYTEPTTSAIYTAQMGFLIADIAYTGVSAYFGRPELGVDALKAGHRLLDRLWKHSDELRASLPAHELLGEAFLLVTSVASGGNIAVPGLFELSLIRKILPGESLDEAAESIRSIAAGVADEHGVECAVSFSAPRDHRFGGTPDEIAADHPGVAELADSIESVTGAPARIEGAPYWSEKPFLRALGIGGVYFAPGDISNCHTPFERLGVEELVTATRTLAHFIAHWCGAEDL